VVVHFADIKFGLIWFSDFRGEDLDVKVYDGHCDGKSSHGLWPGELNRGSKKLNYAEEWVVILWLVIC